MHRPQHASPPPLPPADPRPISRGSRPISVKSSSTTHKRTQSPKAFSTASQASTGLSEHHFKEGDILLKEQQLGLFYESYRQGFKTLKIQLAHNLPGFESRFTSRCAVLLSQTQKYLDEKQPELAKEMAECILALCEEFGEGAAAQIPITSSFMNSQVGLRTTHKYTFAPVRFNALNKLGLSERHLGNLQSGLEHLLTAIDIGEQQGLNVGETWVNLAAVHMSMKNWRKGRHSALEAVKNLTKENEVPYQKKIARLLAIANYNAGKCNEKLNDLQEAIENYRAGIKVLKSSAIDPQEQVYKSVSYAFLQAMKDFKDGTVKRKLGVEPVDQIPLAPREEQPQSETFKPKKFTVMRTGQQRPGTAMSMNRSRDQDLTGFRSPMSNQTNPLSKSITLKNKSESRGQLFASFQKSQDLAASRDLRDSQDKGFFNTVGGAATIKLDAGMNPAPVKSPWVIRSKATGNPPSKPGMRASTNAVSSSGNLQQRQTVPADIHATPPQVSIAGQRHTHTQGELHWRESESGLGNEESWDENGHIQYKPTAQRRSLVAKDVMRQNRMQLALELKDINQRLIGMDLVPLRLPKSKLGGDDKDEPNVHQVVSGGPRFEKVSSHRLKQGIVVGSSTGIKTGPPVAAVGSKKTLVIVRKQNTQSGRNSHDSNVNSAEIMTPTEVNNPRFYTTTDMKPPVPPLSKAKGKRGESLSEPSPKHSLNNELVAKKKPLAEEQGLAAHRIQRNWKGGKLSLGRFKAMVRKRYPASTFVCSYYLKIPRDSPPLLQKHIPTSSANSAPVKVLLFLHKDSFLLIYFLLPSMAPNFTLVPKTMNVLGQPDRLRLSKESELYFSVATAHHLVSGGPKTDQKTLPGEDTVRPLFQEDSSVDQTPAALVKRLDLPPKDVSQDEDLLQPLIPISASGRATPREHTADPSVHADQEIEQLKEKILNDYLQDGVETDEVVAFSKAGTGQAAQPVRTTTAALVSGQPTIKVQQIKEPLPPRSDPEAEALKSQQESLLQELKKLQLEREQQAAEIARQKAEAAELAKRQEEAAAEAARRIEAEAKRRAEEIELEVSRRLAQQREEEARLLQLKVDLEKKAKEQQEEEKRRLEMERQRQEALLAQEREIAAAREAEAARVQREENERQQRLAEEQAKAKKEEEALAQEKLRVQAALATQKAVVELQQGMAKLFVKKGAVPKVPPKAVVVTKRYGAVSDLEPEQREKAREEATVFLQDYMRYSLVAKGESRRGRRFLGALKVEENQNVYLVEAHQIEEKPELPFSASEVVVSGMGIVKLCVLKPLSLDKAAKLQFDSCEDEQQLKLKVLQFLRTGVLVKDGTELALRSELTPTIAPKEKMLSSDHTAEFGQISSEKLPLPPAASVSSNLQFAPVATQDSPAKVSSGETPSHQSLDLGSAPLRQSTNPVATNGATSPTKTAVRPPMIMITPAPPVSDVLTPSPSRELFQFMFMSPLSLKCRVVYKEPSPQSPIIEYFSSEGVFLGFEVCVRRVQHKEEVARLLRWTVGAKTPKLDYNKEAAFASSPSVEGTGLF